MTCGHCGDLRCELDRVTGDEMPCSQCGRAYWDDLPASALCDEAELQADDAAVKKAIAAKAERGRAWSLQAWVDRLADEAEDAGDPWTMRHFEVLDEHLRALFGRSPLDVTDKGEAERVLGKALEVDHA